MGKAFIAVLILVILTGCGTISTFQRGNSSDRAGLYNGLCWDIEKGNATDRTDMRVMYFLDMPLSLVADTILLPVSAIKMWAEEGMRHEHPEIPTD